MRTLTRHEAHERVEQVVPDSIEVDIDMSKARDLLRSDFPVISPMTLTTSSPSVVVDFGGKIDKTLINQSDMKTMRS